MATRIRIYNKKTGDWINKTYPDEDAAFEDYWKMSDEDDPDLDIELITSG